VLLEKLRGCGFRRRRHSERQVFIGTMLRYVKALYIQTTYTALSNAHHIVEERLAKRLLMCHDRSFTNEMALTHEFLSVMLAVRRPSVTTSLHVLEGMGFIRAARGKVVIRDRQGLEGYARDACGLPEGEYTRLVGPMTSAAGFASSAAVRKANQQAINALVAAPGESEPPGHAVVLPAYQARRGAARRPRRQRPARCGDG
jgi:hypothetical protein